MDFETDKNPKVLIARIDSLHKTIAEQQSVITEMKDIESSVLNEALTNAFQYAHECGELRTTIEAAEKLIEQLTDCLVHVDRLDSDLDFLSWVDCEMLDKALAAAKRFREGGE